MKTPRSGIEIIIASGIIILIGVFIYALYKEHSFINEHKCQQTGKREIYRIDDGGWVHYRREYKCDDGLHWSTVDK